MQNTGTPASPLLFLLFLPSFPCVSLLSLERESDPNIELELELTWHRATMSRDARPTSSQAHRLAFAERRDTGFASAYAFDTLSSG